MPTKPLTTFRCMCSACGTAFDDFVLLGGYGELLARSRTGRMLFVDTLADPVFDEVSQMASRTLDDIGIHLPAPRTAEVVQGVFGLTCDPDEEGFPFEIGATPLCPACGSDSLAEWRETNELKPVNLATPTHAAWSLLTDVGRAKLIRAAVTDACSG